jgi:hypothetical protein
MEQAVAVRVLAIPITAFEAMHQVLVAVRGLIIRITT